MIGIILAGGKATRLGPLAAQLNKSLVTVGQKPMLVRQAQQLQSLGCEEVVVVVSPGASDQVNGVIERAGLRGVTTVTQPRPEGPADAVACALSTRRPEQEVVIMTADTVLADYDLLRANNFCAVANPPTCNRIWCIHTREGWMDEVPASDVELVAIGHYRFRSLHGLRAACYSQPRGADNCYQLSDMMNAYAEQTGWRVMASVKRSWQDVGDVPALAEANRKHFIAREFNGIEMIQPGVLKKTGNGMLRGQIDFLTNPPLGSDHLFPRVFSSSIGEEGGPWYTMEYIDSPSLAELWLYWPAQPEMWQHVAAELVSQLQENLWSKAEYDMRRDWEGDTVTARADKMWVGKLLERWPFGDPLVTRVAELSERLVATAEQYSGLVHGDPMFGNVLWSLRTGSFKLLDPRGDWGGRGPLGDIRYDLAKIAFSPVICPIMHGLGDHWELRVDEIRALEKPLLQYAGAEELNVACANLLLASAPLHSRDEGTRMYKAAERIVRGL